MSCLGLIQTRYWKQVIIVDELELRQKLAEHMIAIKKPKQKPLTDEQRDIRIMDTSNSAEEREQARIRYCKRRGIDPFPKPKPVIYPTFDPGTASTMELIDRGWSQREIERVQPNMNEFSAYENFQEEMRWEERWGW